MTFENWWNLHKKDECHCKGSCLYRILMLQESWSEEKAKKRLLGFLRIQPEDEYAAAQEEVQSSISAK